MIQKMNLEKEPTPEPEEECYDLITQVATLGLRLEDELGVRGRKCTID